MNWNFTIDELCKLFPIHNHPIVPHTQSSKKFHLCYRCEQAFTRYCIYITGVNRPLRATVSIWPVWTGLYGVLFVVFQDTSTCLTRSWWRFGRRRTIATGAETSRPSSPSPTPTTRRPSCSAPCRTPSAWSRREQPRLTSSNPHPPKTTTPYFLYPPPFRSEQSFLYVKFTPCICMRVMNDFWDLFVFALNAKRTMRSVPLTAESVSDGTCVEEHDVSW